MAGEASEAMGAVAARLAAAEAELEAARGGRTLAEAKIEKLQHYVQVRRGSGGEGMVASGGCSDGGGGPRRMRLRGLGGLC